MVVGAAKQKSLVYPQERHMLQILKEPLFSIHMQHEIMSSELPFIGKFGWIDGNGMRETSHSLETKGIDGLAGRVWFRS